MTARLAIVVGLAAGCAPAAVAPAPATTTAPAPDAPTTAVTVPTTVATTVPPSPVPPPARAGRSSRSTLPPEGNAGAMEQQLAAIARCESGGDYGAENPTSTASGRYQVLDSTWDGYGGYQRAVDAPPAVQEAWAREAWREAGTRPWRASRDCWRRAG